VRPGRQRRALQEIGDRIARHIQEGIIGERARLFGIDQLNESGIDACGELFCQYPVLVKRLPLHLAVGLGDENPGRDGQGKKKHRQPAPQSFPVKSCE